MGGRRRSAAGSAENVAPSVLGSNEAQKMMGSFRSSSQLKSGNFGRFSKYKVGKVCCISIEFLIE